MKNKLLIALLSFVGTATLPLGAQTAAPAPAPAASSASWTLTPAFASQYMFRGARLGGFSFQPTLEYGDGPVVAGVWGNLPLSGKVVGQSDPEFDFYGSYTIETIKDTLSWVPGVTIYTYPNAKNKDGFYKATFEPSLALNYSVAGWKFTPKFYYDFVLKGATYEATAAYALPLKDLGTEFDFTATVGTFKWTDALADSTPTAKNYGNYFLVGGAMPFQLTKNSKLTVGLAYTKGSDNYVKLGNTPKFANSAAVGRGVLTVSYAITF